MTTTIIILIAASAMFVHGKIRSDIVALLALLSLMLTGILTPTEALSGFSSSIIMMMAGIFIVGGAVFQTGLARIISRKILSLAGNSENKLFLLIMLVTSGIGAFVSNTGTVALMLPIVVSMAAGAGVSPSRFLMPLAFASSMGGMLTLIGTAPNMVISDALVSAGYPGLTLFSFLPVGIVCVSLGTVLLMLLSKYLLNKKKESDKDGDKGRSLYELADKYSIRSNVYRVRVAAGSPLTLSSLRDLKLTGAYNISIVEIRHVSHERNLFGKKLVEQIIPTAETVLVAGEEVHVMGAFEDVRTFSEEMNAPLMDKGDVDHSAVDPQDEYKFDAIGIAEVVLLSTSRLIKNSVQDAKFRYSYGVNILGVQRQDETILRGLKDFRFQAGDAILVQGTWQNIARLNNEHNEWVVVGQPLTEASKLTLDDKAPFAAVILVGMVLVMTLNILPPVTAVMIAALGMIFTGCYRNVEEAYKTINWETMVLIGAMLPMSVAVEKTGAATLVAEGLVQGFGGYGPRVLLAAIYVATSILTLFISNTATAVLFCPIALQSAAELGISPYPFLFGVTVAASMCFASPFSTPPNALVMAPGRYSFIDYVKVGVPLQIVFAVVMVLVLPIIFPFAK